MHHKTPESGYCISEMKECKSLRLMAEISNNRLGTRYGPPTGPYKTGVGSWDRVDDVGRRLFSLFRKGCVLISVPEAKWLTKTNVKTWLGFFLIYANTTK
jgi:hypothetical protein